jgi:hypothetical protein
MRGTISPFPQYVFMAWCLVKHRDNFTFYLKKYGYLSTEACLRRGNYALFIMLSLYWVHRRHKQIYLKLGKGFKPFGAVN